MNPQNSTLIQALLGDLSSASTTWYAAVLPYAKSIFFTLVGFQLLWTSITFALGKRQGDEFISMLFIMVIDVGFFYALMLNPEWVLDIINSFRAIGREAGGLERLSPDAVVDTGLRLASAIIKTVSLTGLLDFAVAIIVSAFIAIAILASFAFIAARMVLILAEIFFAVNISPMLIAFSGLSATKYIATQYIGYVIGAGIQLLVMYLLIGSGLEVATRWAEIIIESGSSDINAFMLVGLASGLYAVLVWNLPKLIGGLSAGAPQMSSGGIRATRSGINDGIQLGRGTARRIVDGGESLGITAKAVGGSYSARRVSGKGRTNSVAGASGSLVGAVAASGVNSLLGRYGRPKTAERLATSSAKVSNTAKTKKSNEAQEEESSE